MLTYDIIVNSFKGARRSDTGTQLGNKLRKFRGQARKRPDSNSTDLFQGPLVSAEQYLCPAMPPSGIL